MNVVDMLPSGKKLIEAICAGENISEADALQMVLTGGNDEMLATGRNPLYGYYSFVLAYTQELQADCDRQMNEWRGESKSQ